MRSSLSNSYHTILQVDNNLREPEISSKSTSVIT